MVDQELMKLVLQAGSFGLLAWFFIFGFNRFLDRLDAHAVARDKTFKETIDALMKMREDDRKEITTSIALLADRVDQGRREARCKADAQTE